MLRVNADTGFPMPATLAFLTVGFAHSGEDGFSAAIGKFHLGDIE